MAGSVGRYGPAAADTRELMRWDGDLFTLSGDLLAPRAGPVALYFDLVSGGVMERNAVRVSMANRPTPDQLVELIARLAETWYAGRRRGVVVRYRPMDELEARRAWGDR